MTSSSSTGCSRSSPRGWPPPAPRASCSNAPSTSHLPTEERAHLSGVRCRRRVRGFAGRRQSGASGWYLQASWPRRPRPTRRLSEGAKAQVTPLLSQAADGRRRRNTSRESQSSAHGSRVTPPGTLQHTTGSQPDHELLPPDKSTVQCTLCFGCWPRKAFTQRRHPHNPPDPYQHRPRTPQKSRTTADRPGRPERPTACHGAPLAVAGQTP